MANQPTIRTLSNKVIAYAKKKAPKKKADLIAKFIRLYYSQSFVGDFSARSIEDLYGTALSHWELMDHKLPQEFKVKVFNPDQKRDGWQSTHTIVQIVIRDMPFIVDSVRMELNRMGITIHQMIYMGGMKVTRDKNNHINNVFAYGASATRAEIEAPISALVALAP